MEVYEDFGKGFVLKKEPQLLEENLDESKKTSTATKSDLLSKADSDKALSENNVASHEQRNSQRSDATFFSF